MTTNSNIKSSEQGLLHCHEKMSAGDSSITKDTFDEDKKNYHQQRHNNSTNNNNKKHVQLILSHSEEMNPLRRNTMEDRCVIHKCGTWGCHDPNITYIGIYDGHGGREIVDYLNTAMHYHVAEELRHEEVEDVQSVAADEESRTSTNNIHDDENDKLDNTVHSNQCDMNKKNVVNDGNDNKNNNDAETDTKDNKDSENNNCIDMETRLVRAFLMADINSRLAGLWTSGATVAVCLIKHNHTNPNSVVTDSNNNTNNGIVEIVTANVGDSRIVLGTCCTITTTTSNSNADCESRDEETMTSVTNTTSSSTSSANTSPDSSSVSTTTLSAKRLSYDHRVDDPNEYERIVQSGGFIFRGRVVGILAVTRSIGDHVLKEYVIGHPHVHECTIHVSLEEESNEEFVHHSQLHTNDACKEGMDRLEKNDVIQTMPQRTITKVTSYTYFVILACDGLWDVMTDDDAVKIVHEYNGPKQDVAHHLIQQALERGTTDNVTAVVVWFVSSTVPDD